MTASTLIARTLLITALGGALIACGGSDNAPDAGADTGDTADASGDAGADSSPDGTDAPDVGADADVDEVDGLNACGGDAALTHAGAAAAPGDACGCGGALACDGDDALVCEGGAAPNACGGCGTLPGSPGGDCGDCGGGIWVCAGGSLSCDGARAENLCGGCDLLDAAPGAPCGLAEPASHWTCDGDDAVTCAVVDEVNACGGTGALEFEGLDARPGEACEATCGPGTLLCDAATGELRCDGPPTDACGGCDSPHAELGAACGCDSAGTWSCADGALTCDGGDTRDCAACSPAASAPGGACGACGGGETTCDSNWRPVCSGDSGADARNDCGGCAELSEDLGGACGLCASQTCGGGDVRCAFDAGATGCVLNSLSCADAGCSDDNRECLVGEAGVDAECGGCLEGFSLRDGACVEPITCDFLDCEAQGRWCVEEAGVADRFCGGCLPTHDAVGDECVPRECAEVDDCPPITSEWSECTFVATCDLIARQSRTITARTCDVEAGRCVNFIVESEIEECAARETEGVECGDGLICETGACVPAVTVCDTNDECEPDVGDWSECAWADGCAETASRSRQVRPRQCLGGVCQLTAATFERDDCEPRTTDGAACGFSSTCSEGACLGTPTTPTGLTASVDRTDGVGLTWNAVTGATRYEIEFNGSGVWVNVGPTTTYTDTGAPTGRIIPCSGDDLTASRGTFTDRVDIACTNVTRVDGDERSYRVRAVNLVGTGAATASVTGRRTIGPVAYLWQHHTASTGAFQTLTGATAPTHSDTGALADGTSRWYRVRLTAVGAAGVFSGAVEGFRAPPPIAPTGVTATTNRTDAVRLTWNPVTGATGYEVEVVSGSNNWVSVGLATEYVDSTAPAGAITPCLGGGLTASKGAFSDRVALGCVGASPNPGSNRIYRVRALNASGAGAASGATGNRVIGPIEFQWERSATQTGTFTPLSGATTANYNDATAPADGSQVWYRVALSATGASGVLSPAVSGYRLALPMTPTGLVASDDLAPFVQVSWGSVVGADRYEIEFDGSGVWQSAGSSTTFEDTDAPTGSVVACSGTGLSASQGSSALHVALRCDNPSSAPGASRSYRVRAVNAAGTSAPTASASGSRVVGSFGYQWQRSSSQSGPFTNISGGITATYNDTGAPADGSVAWYRVAVSAAGTTSQTSAAVSGFRRPAPPAPTGLVATTDRLDNVVLTWQPVEGSTGYEVEFGLSNEWTFVGDATEFTDVAAPAATITPCADAGLAASQGTSASHVTLTCSGSSATQGATRTYRVRAVNEAGAGAPSSQVNGNRAVGSLTYQWRRADFSGGDYEVLPGATAPTHNDDTAPEDGSARWYRVTLTAPGATTVNTSSVSGFRLTTTPAPLGVAATTTRTSDVRVSWQATATADRYEIEFDLSGDWTDVGNVTSYDDTTAPAGTITPCVGDELSVSQGTFVGHIELTCAGAGVDEGASRVYRVRAVNEAGISAPSVDATGRRAVGELNYRWRFSSSQSGPFADLAGATTPSTIDDTAPADGSLRWYVVLLSATGTTPVTTPAVSGFRTAAPNIPTGVTASTDLTAGVTVTWAPAARAAGYEVEIDGSDEWIGLGNVTSYDDVAAENGTITPCSGEGLTASKGTSSSHVALACQGASAAPGAARSYRVRAVNAAGTSGASSAAVGQRAVGPVGYEWQASSEEGGFYAVLEGASTAEFNDTDAPAEETRWYRVVLTSAGATTVTTGSVSGYRLFLPPPPSGIAATSNSFESVGVSWFTSPSATGYEVEIDGSGTWISVGANNSLNDTNAPAATIAACTSSLTASQGTSAAHVALACTGSSVAPGTIRSYRVRSLNANGPGEASDPVTGRRVAGEITFQWQRSETEGGTYTNLPGATTANRNDTTAPADGSVRWYRILVSAEGAATVTSESRSGFRLAP